MSPSEEVADDLRPREADTPMTDQNPDPYHSPALVISECQVGILESGRSVTGSLAEQAETRGIVDRIGTLANRFRERGLPVVHCLIEHRADQIGMLPNSYLGAMALRSRTMTAGTRDVAVPAALGPKPSDIVSSRATGLTAFYGTDLDAMLRHCRVRTLVLTGVSTNVALPGLAMEAVNRGYDVALAEDCTAGSSAEAHEFFVRNQLALLARITTAADVAARLP
ncbi:cysteine hydrolase [Nocardioides panzhihuensis]|uniref:Nicotinamidase-related amidase n=1 Tax=Nocardioides panzhihuensis TaxID=860243 RepID=A0A7Z0DMR1_9ACTN|nr:cysteine hydrolase [Nocardioides panzhihuensis]NYI78332.1 nicotinamidase-related amidase [Nocardioides panzhihuensis]